MTTPGTAQEPSIALAPAEDCEPVFRWTKDSRIVRGCKS